MSTLNTTNIKHAGNTGDANLVLAADGTSTFNNDVTIDGDLSANKVDASYVFSDGTFPSWNLGKDLFAMHRGGTGVLANSAFLSAYRQNGNLSSIVFQTVSNGAGANPVPRMMIDGGDNTVKIGNALPTTANITLNADGSAKFAGAKFAFETDGSANFYGQEATANFALLSLHSNYGSNEKLQFKVTSDGNVYSKGNMSSPLAAFGDNISIFLEPDDPANYTTTMVDGEEQRVYSGPTLDVKEKLLEFVARIEALEATNASLEARLTALEGGN